MTVEQEQASAFANALRRREELQHELTEIERFIQLYRHFAGEGQGSMTLNKRGRPNLIRDAIERLLREHGRPMMRGELVHALASLGIDLPPGDQGRYIGTVLWRERETRFVNVDGHGYWLKTEPCERIGYSPKSGSIEY